MKRIMIILVCLAGTVHILAQGTKPAGKSADTSQVQTLFHKGSDTCKLPRSYFIELNGGYSHFGHKSVFLPGISMGLILNHHWTVGMTGNFVGQPMAIYNHHAHGDSTGTNRHESSLSGGYGGLLLEYTLFPRSKVHVSFPLTIGGGYLVRSHHAYSSDSIYMQKGIYHEYAHGMHFFVVEPGVKLELNVIKNLRIGLGVSYRYSPQRSHLVSSPDLLDQFTARLSIRLGKF